MTKSQWRDILHARLAQAARVDPMQCEHHPAYKGLLKKIDELVQFGLQRGWITMEEAAML